MAIEEIAEALGVTVPQVSVILTRARSKFQRRTEAARGRTENDAEAI